MSNQRFSIESVTSVDAIAAMSADRVNKVVDSAVAGYTKAKKHLHIAACAGLYHADVHGDIRPLKRLLTAMGSRSQLRHNIAAWVREEAHYLEDDKVKNTIIAAIDKDGNVNVRVASETKRKERPVDMEHAFANPFYEMVAAPVKAPSEMKYDTLIASLEAIVSGEKKADEKLTQAAPKMLAALAA